MIHKILKVGDSAAVTIPKQVLKDMGVKIGDRVTVNYVADKKSVTIESLNKEHAYPISREFHGMVKEFITRYKPALDELSKR
jgi:putative addiction module antidote